MAYDKNTDYSALMDAAAARGDYAAAGAYEKQRNEKIAGEGLNYEQTNRYTGNLDKTDYGDMLKNQMASGASANDVADTLKARNQKISTAENLSPHANDELSRAALQYIAKGSGNNGFSYASAPAYASKYQSAVDSLVGDILGGSYEKWTQGADYAALKDRYTQNGKLAMRDTLAETSARTGGLDSTYSQAAANKAYSGYMADLEAAAREMYNADRTDKYNSLSLLRGLDSDDYGRFTDNRAFNYQLGRDSVSDARYEREYADQTARADRDYADAQNREAAEKSLMAAQIAAYSGNYKPLADYYGVSENEARAYMAAQMNTGKSSGSGSKSSGGNNETAAGIYDGLSDNAVISALMSKFNKNGTLSADEFDALYERGYRLNLETGKLESFIRPYVEGKDPNAIRDISDLGPEARQIAEYIVRHEYGGSMEKIDAKVRAAWNRGILSVAEAKFLMDMYD